MRRNSDRIYPSLHQGDIVLIDYGKNSTEGRRSVVKPSLIVSNDKMLKTEKSIYVIPLFRRPSRDPKSENMLLTTKDCRGLKYDEYIQPGHMQLIHVCRIKRHLGEVVNNDVLQCISQELYERIAFSPRRDTIRFRTSNASRRCAADQREEAIQPIRKGGNEKGGACT